MPRARRSISLLHATLLVGAALLTGAAGLSGQLAIGAATSNFGSTTLAPGFSPDPHSVSILSGGDLSVEDMNLGSGCVGYATRAPDYTVDFTGASSRLRFYVEGEGDTGLVVAGPGKSIRCNDDWNGLDPMVTFNDAGAGRYDVWVSSYSSGENISSTLYVTELDYEPGSSSFTGDLAVGGSESYFGSTSLSAGFMPDPFTVAVTPGGSNNVSSMDLGSGCVGYAGTNPDFILDYEAGMSMLRIYFEGDGDTALVINAPDGSWHCDDDSYGTVDPTVTFDDPRSGQYDIWVATYQSEMDVYGTLKITELDSSRPGN